MGYSELHARSCFSFLDGASSPEELVHQALQLGLPALALTDLNGVYGVVAAREALVNACELTRKNEGAARLKLLYGSELHFDDDCAVALVQSREGYANLTTAITEGRLAGGKGEFKLSLATLAQHNQGLFFLCGGPRSAAMRLLQEGQPAQAEARLGALRDALGKELPLHVELVRHQAPGDHERSLAMAALAKRLKLPLVATNDVYFHAPDRKPFHDILRCVQGGFPLAEAGRRLLPNPEAHLKTGAQLERLFCDLPGAVARSGELASQVRFSLCDVRYHYPAPDLPPGESADAYLARLCHEGLKKRLGAAADRHLGKLRHELNLIAELEYAGYFLTMYEVVLTCDAKGILCQGRGSAANSLVCFSLGITSVPPDTIDMLFERFISRERREPPDIDLDIEHERREEIIQHVYAKYGRRHAAMVCEVIRYQWRSALRDVGKALGFQEAQLLRMSKFLSHAFEDLTPQALEAAGVEPGNPKVRQLLELTRAMTGIPRHLSIHVGGFVLSEKPLSQSVPIENGRMADRTVIQWNKDDVDAMGMFKLDLLGLGMLTVLSKCFALVKRHQGVLLTLQTVPAEDPETFQMLRASDSVGVFQVESRAQMNMLARLKPTTFYDLVIEVAIVRPGPIQGKMVHPFLRRRRGEEEVHYPHPKLKAILHKTLGVPLFQEQVMRLAEAVGGYTAGQADQLRRDMAAWNSGGKLDRHRDRLIEGMQKSGLSLPFAERVFEQMRGFGSYGFPESHAAAFAHLAYVSAYLKRHFPAEFACALLNAQPMGFYSPAVIINDAKRHGLHVLPTDIQHSRWDCSLESGALRLGLRLVRGLGEAVGNVIVRAREADGPFRSVEALLKRAGLPKRALVPLAAAGALDSLYERREALWRASGAAQGDGALFRGVEINEPKAELPRLSELERLTLDGNYAQAFPGRHPMELVREKLERQGVLSARELAGHEPNRQVSVAGLVITRQKPDTAQGVVFVTVEDETGHVDISFSRGAFHRFQDVVRLSTALVVRGTLLADGRARNVIAAHAAPLNFSGLRSTSHDFH